ncbi:DNA-deoxyinosine glycosylase [Halomonas denitrificans]|nr:DNA-deoxyinosine glycosylase [Halomonas denitrificans]
MPRTPTPDPADPAGPDTAIDRGDDASEARDTDRSSSLLTGLPPVVRDDARVLVLGSMPGVRSLDEARYYAHPRNAFWPIVGPVIGQPPSRPYAARLNALRERGIALWDVIGRCRRAGSLDSSIEADSVEVNDLPGLIDRCRQLALIAFNGARAEQEFRRRVLPRLGSGARAIRRVRLPSTSPANARLGLEDKRRAWHAQLGPALAPVDGDR